MASENTTRDATESRERLEPWIEDADIIIVVQGNCFRVHRAVLSSHSEVFEDVFTIFSDNGKTDVIDGCPAIHLGDAVDDVQIMLKALYLGSSVSNETPVSIPVLRAFLRMGKKYAIQPLFEDGRKRLSLGASPLAHVSELSAASDTPLFPQISGNDPFNFAIVHIASEVGLFSAVVFAIFYICLACPPFAIAEGYQFNGQRYTLSNANKRYCFRGQRYLTEAGGDMINSFTLLSPHGSQRIPAPHPEAASALLLMKRHEEAWSKLWRFFPVVLGLGPWEDLDKDAKINQESGLHERCKCRVCARGRLL